MTNVQPSVFIADCVTLLMKRAMLTLAVVMAACLLLGGCGEVSSVDLPRSRAYTIAIDNQSTNPVKLRFDALLTGNCEKGHVKETIPSLTSRVVDISFTGCVNGGGEKIDAVVYEFQSLDSTTKTIRESVSGTVLDGSKILCTETACKLVTK